MLALGLTLALFAAPSARLMPEEPMLSLAQVTELDRELRVLTSRIQELKPRMPTGFILGIAFGFSFAVLLIPGLPLLVSGALGSGVGALIAFGGVLTAIGGLGLVAALICIALGNNAESDLADERARMVERRDDLKRQLAPYQQPPPTSPQYVPGVQRDVPAPRLVTLARF